MKKLLIINGPNLNRLGLREPEKYGTETFEDILTDLRNRYLNECKIDFFQSNHEGSIIDHIQLAEEYDGLIINAGAYSHYSYAILDALNALSIPKIEVHLTNIYAREAFRSHSVISAACRGVVSGFGRWSYFMAVEWFLFAAPELRG